MKTAATDLPVLKPFRAAPIAPSGLAAPMMLSAGLVAGVAIVFVASLAVAQATAPAARDGAVTILLRWAPLIFQGFLFNLLISVLSMALGTAIGVLLGIAGAVALKPPAQKHAIHGALVIALLGVAGSLANVVKFGQLIDGTAERPAAVLVSTIMFLVLLVYLAFGVRSFVAARRSRGRLSSSEANGSRS